MKFIFVRHGRTHFNEIGLTQGWCDSPLSKIGEKQVQNMREQLLEIPITKAYSSNLGRAVETAKILIKKRNVELEVDERLKEINFGIMEGVSTEIVDRLHIESMDWLNDMNMDYRPYEGEEIHDVIKRQREFLEEIREKHSQQDTILIIGHGCSLYALIKSLISKEQKLEIFENAGAVIVDEKEGSYAIDKILRPQIEDEK